MRESRLTVIASEAKQSQLTMVEIASARKDARRNDAAIFSEKINHS
jgi:hypothetical protein